ncbi:hypothetical protein ANANG_G00187850 [Anguilla anguilla]|uniref:ARF GTPase-activating protein GIT1 C-terminal domain-containing protein n=1 Tax=Anguilla anguilla TaxID=7936 RepID=A0A9D3M441_ANGAN|nr:hypothetical protein ANANG_G00187850 [Anguilla anguilla]
MSMYETGSGLKPYLPKGEAPYPEEGTPSLQPFPPHASKLEKQSSMPDSDYDNTTNDAELDESGLGRKSKLRTSGWQGEGSIPELDDLEVEPDPALPSTEDVIRKTEQITKNIQELLRAAQENKHESFIPCSERIHVAVTEMAALFPKKPRSETVRGSLRLLTSSAHRLQGECRKAAPPDSSPAPAPTCSWSPSRSSSAPTTSPRPPSSWSPSPPKRTTTDPRVSSRGGPLPLTRRPDVSARSPG